MTKTQANEPGFVLDAAAKAIYECKGLHLSTGRQWEGATAADRHYCSEYATAALAAAPIVPAPAYGVKEALEPFAKADRVIEEDGFPDGHVIHAAKNSEGEHLYTLTAGAFRRARAAYDALSSAPVEEADAKARPSDDQLWDQTLAERDNYHDAADKLAEAIGELLGVNVGEHSSAHSPWETALEHAGQAVRKRALSTPTASTIPSEPEAKGEAGAGPVGESVSIHAYAQEYEFRCDDGGGYTPTEAERAMIEDAITGFLAEASHPVEEPGEVERLVEETGSSSVDDLRDMALVGHSLMEVIGIATADGPYKDWSPAENPTEIVIDLINDLEEAITRAERAEQFQRANGTARQIAEAALAETRERLEKVEAALCWYEEHARIGGDSARFAIFRDDHGAKARAALSTQESSAALAGDGMEVVR